MKRILIISREYPPRGGGAGQAAYNLAAFLKEKYEVEIVTVGAEQNNTVKENSVTYARFIPKLFILTFMREILRKKPQDFDYIILNDIGAVITAGLCFTEALLNKSFVFLHGSEPERLLASPSLYYRVFHVKKIYRRVLMGCRTVIAVSDFMKKKFIRVSGWCELSQKITVVPNAVNTQVFYSEPIDLHKLYHIDENRSIIYSASRITEKKGYAVFYQIFKRLIKDNIPYYWIISGEGDYLKPLKEQCQRDGLSNYVSFTGYFSQEALRQHYSSADVFVLLSQYDEAFGLVYLEASACGLPSIALRKGGTSESIQEGVTGFLADDAEECYLILKEFKYRQLSGKKIRKAAQLYGSEKVYKKYYELFL